MLSFPRQVLFVVSLLATLSSLAEGARAAGLFGMIETASADFTPFPKWTELLKRFFIEKGHREGNCASKEFNACHYARWQKFMDTVRDSPKDQQMSEVNRFMNEAKYIVDPINWGVNDYWATPGQFFEKDGDCEDYAIAEYLTLRALGWPAEQMRVVILQDMNLKVAHAILAVRHEGRNMVLDDQIAMVIEDHRIVHYRPIYSLNEEGWWRHRAP